MFSLMLLFLGAQVSDAKTITFKTPESTLDRAYKHMNGPRLDKVIKFHEQKSEALKEDSILWLTAAKLTLKNEKGEDAAIENICHGNITMSENHLLKHNRFAFYKKRNSMFKPETNFYWRFMTMGINDREVKFPKGFGIPISSSESIKLGAMIASDTPPSRPLKLHYETSLSYLEQNKKMEPMKALFRRSVHAHVLVKGKDCFYGVKHPDKKKMGEGCPKGEAANIIPWAEHKDKMGHHITRHWLLKPKEELKNTSYVTNFFKLPFDTTIHYINVHIHYGVRSMELYDRTAKKSVFTSVVTYNSDGSFTSSNYSDTKGTPVFKNHEYELITHVKNDLDHTIDIMAYMHIYLAEKNIDSTNLKLVTSN